MTEQVWEPLIWRWTCGGIITGTACSTPVDQGSPTNLRTLRVSRCQIETLHQNLIIITGLCPYRTESGSGPPVGDICFNDRGRFVSLQLHSSGELMLWWGAATFRMTRRWRWLRWRVAPAHVNNLKGTLTLNNKKKKRKKLKRVSQIQTFQINN